MFSGSVSAAQANVGNSNAPRRKLLRHTLGKWLEQRNFSGAFDVQRRAEEVPADEYVSLVTAVSAAQ